MLRRLAADQSGFTIVEVLAASVILVVGLLGVLTLIDQATATTTSTKAREQGVALQRELVEAARSVAYRDLAPATVVAKIRETPGFVDCGAAGAPSTGCSTIGSKGWTIVRRGITFHVTAGVCAVDSPNDGLGTHLPERFCATGAGQATAANCTQHLGTSGSVAGSGTATGTAVGDCGLDLNFDGTVDNLTESQAGVTSASGTADRHPEDYKRIVTLVRWDRGAGLRFALQSTRIPYPGTAGVPRITSLAPNGFSNPVLSGTTASFLATTDRRAARLAWLIAGTPAGEATDRGGGAQWEFAWSLGTPGSAATGPSSGEVLDGTYNIGARAVDDYGTSSEPEWYTVTLNRRVAYGPSAFEAVRSPSSVAVRWAPSSEGDIEGYEVYRRSGATATRVCGPGSSTTCVDSSPPLTGTYDYYVNALDRAPDGALRRGDSSATVSIPFDNAVPARPTGATATRTTPSEVRLSWLPPATGDLDGTVVRYRVFRDGTLLANRYHETSDAATLTFIDSKAAGAHTYYVVAVDNLGAQSQMSTGATVAA